MTYEKLPALAQNVLEELRARDPKIIRQTRTDRTTSYIVRVGQPFDVGGPAQVGDVVGGLLVRNSDVGYASLVIALHLTRLVCKNGMVVAESKSIVHRAYRRIGMADLKEKLALGLKDLPSRLQRAGRLLERSGHHTVSDAEAALVELLRVARHPLRQLPIFFAAYAVEPNPTAFGIAQAVTLRAQEAQITPEDRLPLEQAAGKYLRRYGGS